MFVVSVSCVVELQLVASRRNVYEKKMHFLSFASICSIEMSVTSSSPRTSNDYLNIILIIAKCARLCTNHLFFSLRQTLFCAALNAHRPSVYVCKRWWFCYNFELKSLPQLVVHTLAMTIFVMVYISLNQLKLNARGRRWRWCEAANIK